MNEFASIIQEYVDNARALAVPREEEMAIGSTWKGELISTKFTSLLMHVEIEANLPDQIPLGNSLHRAKLTYVGAYNEGFKMKMPFVIKRYENTHLIEIVAVHTSDLEFYHLTLSENENMIQGEYATQHPKDCGTFVLRKVDT